MSMYILIENAESLDQCSMLIKVTVYIKCYFHFRSSLSTMPHSNKISIKIIETYCLLNDYLQLSLTSELEHIISVVTVIMLSGVLFDVMKTSV